MCCSETAEPRGALWIIRHLARTGIFMFTRPALGASPCPAIEFIRCQPGLSLLTDPPLKKVL
jgi:hypothetical protein